MYVCMCRNTHLAADTSYQWLTASPVTGAKTIRTASSPQQSPSPRVTTWWGRQLDVCCLRLEKLDLSQYETYKMIQNALFLTIWGLCLQFHRPDHPKRQALLPHIVLHILLAPDTGVFSMSNFHGEIWHKQNKPQDYHRQNQIISPQNTEFSQCFSSIWSRLRLRSPWLSQAVSTRWSIGWVMEVGTRSQWKIGCLGSVGEVTNTSQNNIRIHTYIITYIYIYMYIFMYIYI